MLRILVGLFAVAVPLVLATGVTAAPPNILLARDRTEPAVAVDPTNSRIVVGSANADYSAPVGDSFPTAYFVSRNGGASFVAGTAPIVPPYTTEADTSIAVAHDGTVFYSYLGESPSYCTGGSSAVVVTHSIDHGRSYRAPTVVDVDPADDKPNMAVESMPRGPSHIFISWTRWHDHTSDIWITRSVDGGATFGRPVRLYSSRRNNFGSVPLVAPNHQIYVFWSAYPDVDLTRSADTRIVLVASRDDGAHFGKPVAAVKSFRAVPSMVQPGLLRVLTMPAVASGTNGTLYVAWAQVRRRYADGHVDADIRTSRSVDSGRTWSSPVRVNDSRRNDRFMPVMSVLSDGSLGIAFYDRRNGAGRLDLYVAHIRVGTVLSTSVNVRVNAGASSVWNIPYIAPGSTCFSPGRFFGDYIGAAACGSPVLCVVWTDTQLHTSDETEVWFARVGLPSSTTTLERALLRDHGMRRQAVGYRDSVLSRLRVLPRGRQVGGRYRRGL